MADTTDSTAADNSESNLPATSSNDEPPAISSVGATKSDPPSDDNDVKEPSAESAAVEDDITDATKAISAMAIAEEPPSSTVRDEVSPEAEDQQEPEVQQQPPVVQQLPLNLPSNLGSIEALDDADAAAAYDNEFLSLLPPIILPRITKLKSLNDARDAILEEYRLERAALEMKFMKRMEPLFDERRGVINGEFDNVIDKENAVQDKNEGGNDEEETGEVKAEGVVEDVSDEEENEDVQNEQLLPRDAVRGIPQFWACAMGHVDVIAELITEGERNEGVAVYIVYSTKLCVSSLFFFLNSIYFFAYKLRHLQNDKPETTSTLT